jgi:hypothetical protein
MKLFFFFYIGWRIYDNTWIYIYILSEDDATAYHVVQGYTKTAQIFHQRTPEIWLCDGEFNNVAIEVNKLMMKDEDIRFYNWIQTHTRLLLYNTKGEI